MPPKPNNAGKTPRTKKGLYEIKLFFIHFLPRGEQPLHLARGRALPERVENFELCFERTASIVTYAQRAIEVFKGLVPNAGKPAGLSVWTGEPAYCVRVDDPGDRSLSEPRALRIVACRGGAFSGLDKIISARTKGTTVGFGADVRAPDERQTGEILKEVEPEDLLKFGLIPEFIGRLPVIATLGDLDEGALVDILTKPKNALVKQYQRLFEMEGVRLEFTEGALRSVARRAVMRKTGARGLRSIMETILLDTMFDLPGLEGVEEVVINREVADEQANPLFIYADRRGDVGSSA